MILPTFKNEYFSSWGTLPRYHVYEVLHYFRHWRPELWLRLHKQIEGLDRWLSIQENSPNVLLGLYTACNAMCYDFTWTQREIMSAKRDRDLAVYCPSIAGSTILDSASMSCSWGMAHLTRDCSPRLRFLISTNTEYQVLKDYNGELEIDHMIALNKLPVVRFSGGQEF